MDRQEMRARQLALDRKHGASFLLRQALLILKDEATELPCDNRLNFLEELAAIAQRLQQARPAMAAIRNGLQLFIDGLEELKAENRLNEPVEAVSGLVDSIIESLDANYHRTVMNGAQLIKSGEQIISCSFSATVASALIQARAEQKPFSVIIVESLWHDLNYGEMMASTLETGGVDCKLIPVDRLYDYVNDSSLGLIGADSVLADGSVINGYPSLQLARACFAKRIPFYCLCESHKIASDYPPLPLEDGFDIIPGLM